MTLGRLVAGLPEIAGRPNRSYLQLAFLIAFIAHQILLWWRLWQLNTVEQWNFLAYFLIISAPLANYLTLVVVAGAVWNKRWIHVLVLVLMLFTFFVTAAAEFTL